MFITDVNAWLGGPQQTRPNTQYNTHTLILAGVTLALLLLVPYASPKGQGQHVALPMGALSLVTVLLVCGLQTSAAATSQVGEPLTMHKDFKDFTKFCLFCLFSNLPCRACPEGNGDRSKFGAYTIATRDLGAYLLPKALYFPCFFLPVCFQVLLNANTPFFLFMVFKYDLALSGV